MQKYNKIKVTILDDTDINIDNIVTKLRKVIKDNGVSYGNYYDNLDFMNSNGEIDKSLKQASFAISDAYNLENQLFIDIKVLSTYFGKQLREKLENNTASFDDIGTSKKLYAYLIENNIFVCHEYIELDLNEEVMHVEDEVMEENPIVDLNKGCCDVAPYIAKYDPIHMELVLDAITVLNEIPIKYDVKEGNIWFKDFMFHFFDNTLRYTGDTINRTYFIARGLAMVYKMKFLDNNLTSDELDSQKGNWELARKYYS